MFQKSFISRADAAFQGDVSTVRAPHPLVLPVYSSGVPPEGGVFSQSPSLSCSADVLRGYHSGSTRFLIGRVCFGGSKAVCGSSLVNIT